MCNLKYPLKLRFKMLMSKIIRHKPDRQKPDQLKIVCCSFRSIWNKNLKNLQTFQTFLQQYLQRRNSTFQLLPCKTQVEKLMFKIIYLELDTNRNQTSSKLLVGIKGPRKWCTTGSIHHQATQCYVKV